jgi:Torus domain
MCTIYHFPFAVCFFRKQFAQQASYYEERNALWLKRPAVKQKEHIAASKSILEGANEYNIWYDKYLGDHWNNNKGNDPAESRCYTETDAGYTKADTMDTKTKVSFAIAAIFVTMICYKP